MFGNITAEQYQLTFDKAIWILQTRYPDTTADLHEFAHRAVENYLSNPFGDLQISLADIFSCIEEWAELQPKVENPKAEEVDEIAKAEVQLDLARLYLTVSQTLSEEDRLLYLKVWSSADLTDTEALEIEELGERIRKVLDAQASSKKSYFFYKTGRGGKTQAFAWQGFFQKKLSAATRVNQTGDRRLSERFRH